MLKTLKKYSLLFADFIGRMKHFIRKRSSAILAGIFAFCLVFSCIFLTISRSIAIKQMRFQLSRTISYLNEFGLDIAYDHIEFNSIFFYPLMTIQNFQIYNTKDLNAWMLKFDEVKGYSNMFGSERVRFKFSNDGLFIFNEFASKMTGNETVLTLSTKNKRLNEIVFHAEDINIQDFAKIKKIAFWSQASQEKSTKTGTPSFESFFEINDVDINGLIDYPLSSHLKLLYAKTALIGSIEANEQLSAGIETWLKDGGFIDVPNLIIQWQPLTLVGRGSINFNELFAPRLNFNTSSKGLLRLIDDLESNSFLDSKNVFVANILLSNKAFKLNPEDEELTISTPISYADGKVSVENLTIKDFNK